MINKAENITATVINCCDEDGEEKYLKFSNWKNQLNTAT
jgi:hypothetical protein